LPLLSDDTEKEDQGSEETEVMSPEEIRQLHETMGELRLENTAAHTEIFNLIRGLASRQDKMNGGLATVKWIIGSTLVITVPLLCVLLTHSF
jgi:hypothetical protein